MLEMASAAGKLLGTAADLPGGAAAAISNAAMSSPLLLPHMAAGSTAAAALAVACVIDLRSGAARLHTAAATSVRQTVHLTAQFTAAPASGSQVGTKTSVQAATADAAAPADSRAARLALLLLVVGATAAASRRQAVAAGVDARCHASSGYDVHPAVGDAAIHAGAAARAAGDTTFLVSTAVGAYTAPSPLPTGESFVSVQLSSVGDDGSVVSSHSIHCGDGGGKEAGSSMPGIAGVQARPLNAATAAAAPPPAPSAVPARASAAISVPEFDTSFVDPPPPPRILQETMAPLSSEFLQQVRLHISCPTSSSLPLVRLSTTSTFAAASSGGAIMLCCLASKGHSIMISVACAAAYQPEVVSVAADDSKHAWLFS